MPSFTTHRSTLAMSDGTLIAYSLYLPDVSKPVPALLEALPYRKDDGLDRDIYAQLSGEFEFAVCRVDLRGTGSSAGVAADEYPATELTDLATVIAWLADQQWSNGSVGMFGWSYSGFNSIQVAAERPPALKAIMPVYATDDRFNDDSHYMGGALRALDVVDYPSYMIAMNAMPPVPALWGEDWREEWSARLDKNEPWLIRWLEEQRRQPYWQNGSLRPDYGRITCPTMLVAGWADGYRNNTFRTVEALEEAGTPWKLLIGPWSHMGSENSLPGPWVDLTVHMARWFDHWLRDEPNGVDTDAPVSIYHRRSTRPEPDLAQLEGSWRDHPGLPLAATHDIALGLGSGIKDYVVRGDLGVDAWNSCAASLPWGQPSDQRFDDAASLTWDWNVADEALGDADLHVLGHPRLTLRIRADKPVAFVSAKLSDVFEDGTSSLFARGFLNLTHRHGYDADPTPIIPGEWMDVEVELEATAWSLVHGQRLRLAISGTDWPNVTAPPEPVTLTVDFAQSNLLIPTIDSLDDLPESSLPYVTPPKLADGAGVIWKTERDVLARTTTCRTESGSTWVTADGYASEDRYRGSVLVDQRTFDQQIDAYARFDVDYPEGRIATESTLSLSTNEKSFELEITISTYEGGELSRTKSWQRSIPRDLA